MRAMPLRSAPTAPMSGQSWPWRWRRAGCWSASPRCRARGGTASLAWSAGGRRLDRPGQRAQEVAPAHRLVINQVVGLPGPAPLQRGHGGHHDVVQVDPRHGPAAVGGEGEAALPQERHQRPRRRVVAVDQPVAQGDALDPVGGEGLLFAERSGARCCSVRQPVAGSTTRRSRGGPCRQRPTGIVGAHGRAPGPRWTLCPGVPSREPPIQEGSPCVATPRRRHPRSRHTGPASERLTLPLTVRRDLCKRWSASGEAVLARTDSIGAQNGMRRNGEL
jgi:hypothetical protein